MIVDSLVRNCGIGGLFRLQELWGGRDSLLGRGVTGVREKEQVEQRLQGSSLARHLGAIAPEEGCRASLSIAEDRETSQSPGSIGLPLKSERGEPTVGLMSDSFARVLLDDHGRDRAGKGGNK